MNHYLVITPQMEHSYSFEDFEPPEYYSDTCEIQANNKEDAKILALHCKDMEDWINEARSFGRNPLFGLKIENMKCNHNKCWCSECINKFGECEDCLNEIKSTMEIK